MYVCIYIYAYTFVFMRLQFPPCEIPPGLWPSGGLTRGKSSTPQSLREGCTQNRCDLGSPRPLFEIPEPSTHPILSWTRFSSNSRERFAAKGRHRHPENLNFPNGFLIILGIHSTLRVFRMSHLKTTTLNTFKTGNKYQKGGAEFSPFELRAVTTKSRW